MCRMCWKWHCCKVLNVSLFPSKRANFVHMRSSVLWHLHHITTDSGLKWPCQLFSSFPLPLIPFNKQTKQKSCSSLQISFAVSCCSVFISRNKRNNLSLFCSDSPQIRSAANVSSISNLLSVSAPFFFSLSLWSGLLLPLTPPLPYKCTFLITHHYTEVILL